MYPFCHKLTLIKANLLVAAFHFLKVSCLFPSVIIFDIYSFIFMYMYVYVPAWAHVHHVHAIPKAASGGR